MKRMARFPASTAAGVALIALCIASSPAQAVPINSNFDVAFDDDAKATAPSSTDVYNDLNELLRVMITNRPAIGGVMRPDPPFTAYWPTDTIIIFKSAGGMRLMGVRYPVEPAIAPPAISPEAQR